MVDWRSLGVKVFADVLRDSTRPKRSSRRRTTSRTRARTASSTQVRGRHLGYAPKLDGAADPGEIVWTWVGYEEGNGQGKDRPVLVVGRDGDELLGLMLSSNAGREGQRGWLGLGAGSWDAERRSSWIRLDRVLSVPEHGIRREGAVLDRARFDLVADALREDYGWR
ncbi:MAG: type toxin-antitoxin system PemK/MazF family toxin [Frankiales bacterium]|nr:type toxin-antitoxin system PemK/MazF family toxin [Frankiales bacterium]